MSFFRAHIDRFAPCLAVMLICFLVWTQVSGLHLHLPEDGDHAHAHVHAAHAPGHDHAAHHDAADEFDLSLTTLVKQLLVLLFALIATCPLFRVSAGSRAPRPADIRLSRRPWFRFTTPLRGPPLTV